MRDTTTSNGWQGDGERGAIRIWNVPRKTRRGLFDRDLPVHKQGEEPVAELLKL